MMRQATIFGETARLTTILVLGRNRTIEGERKEVDLSGDNLLADIKHQKVKLNLLSEIWCHPNN